MYIGQEVPKMGVSHRFSNQARDLYSAPCFLPCVCGQVHYGDRLAPGTESISRYCTICEHQITFDMAHVGLIPAPARPLMKEHIPCPFIELDPIAAQLDMSPGLEIARRRTWRVSDGGVPLNSKDGMVAVFDVRGHLLHLGYYQERQIIRSVYLHQESGFIQYRSQRSRITYERGLVEGPLMPGLYEPDTIAVVHRGYRVWRRRMLRRVLGAAQVQVRRRISRYPH